MRFNPPRMCVLLFFVMLLGPAWDTATTSSKEVPISMGRAADFEMPEVGPVQTPAAPETGENLPGNAALSRIRFPWQDLGFRVAFMGRRPGFRALTLVDEQRIEVYLKPDEGPDMVAFDLAHEFGHVVDLKYNDDARRRRWMELRGIDPNTPWYGADACSDFDTPAGDFAETFAYLLLGPGSFHSRMAPPPSREQVQELAAFCNIDKVSPALVN